MFGARCRWGILVGLAKKLWSPENDEFERLNEFSNMKLVG
jgi:hypothetical protein